MKQTPALIKTLLAIPPKSDEMFWGYEIMQATGLKSGTVYPLLKRLENEGMLAASWVGRRRYYYVTSKGRQLVKATKAAEDARKLMSAIRP